MTIAPYWLKNIIRWKKQAHEAAYNMTHLHEMSKWQNYRNRKRPRVAWDRG